MKEKVSGIPGPPGLHVNHLIYHGNGGAMELYTPGPAWPATVLAAPP
jgi:hypothetical protein